MFVSETDTEVIPHLCEYLWQKRGGHITLTKLVRLRGGGGACAAPSRSFSVSWRQGL